MNFLPARWNGGVEVGGHALGGLHAPSALATAGDFMLGVRPEYVVLAQAHAPGAMPASIIKSQDIGTYQLLTAQVGATVLRARLSPDVTAPQAGDSVWLQLLGPRTCYYKNEELVT